MAKGRRRRLIADWGANLCPQFNGNEAATASALTNQPPEDGLVDGGDWECVNHPHNARGNFNYHPGENLLQNGK